QPQARAQFLRQAQAMAQIRHPNLANILQFGSLSGTRSSAMDGTGDCFYAMEFVDGESLPRRIATSGALSTSIALEIVRQVAQVLSIAEKCCLTHGELNSSNIFLVRDKDISINIANNPTVRIKIVDLDLDFQTYWQKAGHPDACALGGILWY